MKRLIALWLVLLMPALVHAQALEIEISGGSAAALPITVIPFEYLGMSVAPDTDLAAVMRADFNRSGQFRTLADADMVEKPIRSQEINFATWRLLKQEYIVIGRILDSPDGGYRTEFELYDVAKQQRLIGLALNGRPQAMRDVAHQIADQVYEKILGVRGAFWTRIAYVTANGVGGMGLGVARGRGRRQVRLDGGDQGGAQVGRFALAYASDLTQLLGRGGGEAVDA